MSMDHAIRFMMYLDKNVELKKEYEAVVQEYEGADLTEEDLERVLRENLLPLAVSVGFEIDPTDLKQLFMAHYAVPLTEDELEQTVGGRGEFKGQIVINPFAVRTYKFSCELAPNNAYLLNMYYSEDYCPNFRRVGNNSIDKSAKGICYCCGNLQYELLS